MQSATTAKDSVLLQHIAAGDLDALGSLYDRYAADLLRFVQRLDTSLEAEDLVQNVFLRALGIARTFDAERANARSWLFGIAVRVAQERRRSFRRWANALLRLQQVDPVVVRPQGEATADVTRGLAHLSANKRLVLVLAEVEEFSCPEIAAMLEIPVGTVWTRLHHARRELREFLEGAKS
jgi:RNA polymerase sigma-70 factor (ECF subfamily)